MSAIQPYPPRAAIFALLALLLFLDLPALERRTFPRPVWWLWVNRRI